MTKKLKRKIKNTAIKITGSLVSIIAIGAIGANLLVMPKIEQNRLKLGEENGLGAGTYTFKVTGGAEQINQTTKIVRRNCVFRSFNSRAEKCMAGDTMDMVS